MPLSRVRYHTASHVCQVAEYRMRETHSAEPPIWPGEGDAVRVAGTRVYVNRPAFRGKVHELVWWYDVDVERGKVASS